jgi:hypothetical protein
VVAGGVRAMIRMALRGTSWSYVIDYASPALFDVIPARALLSQSRELFSNRSDAGRFSRVRQQIQELLRERKLEVELAKGPKREDELRLASLPESERREMGQRILEVFFTQIFGSHEALLDLRSEKLTRQEAGGLCWRPGALYIQWEADFLSGVRDLYLGFYLDDRARFDSALERLHMEGSGDALRDLLGRDDPRNARFETEAFHANFHELFVSYRDRGVALHRNFLPLGVYLMCLYEALDVLGVTLDVRDAVERAQA